MALSSLLKEETAQYKIEKLGVRSITDIELIASILGTDKTEEGIKLVRDLMTSYGNSLTALSAATLASLVERGLTMLQAKKVQALCEFGRRRSTETQCTQLKITSSRDLYEYVFPLLADLFHEEFFVVFLSRSNSIIGHRKLSSGGTAGTVVDTKLLFNFVLTTQGCASIILAHNHPSGNVRPSDADLSLTKRIVEGGKVLDIQVLDHLIIGDNIYYSFADEGKM